MQIRKRLAQINLSDGAMPYVGRVITASETNASFFVNQKPVLYVKR